MRNFPVRRLAAAALIGLFSSACGRTNAEPAPLELGVSRAFAQPASGTPVPAVPAKKEAEPCDPTPSVSLWPPLVVTMRLCGGL